MRLTGRPVLPAPAKLADDVLSVRHQALPLLVEAKGLHHRSWGASCTKMQKLDASSVFKFIARLIWSAENDEAHLTL